MERRVTSPTWGPPPPCTQALNKTGIPKLTLTNRSELYPDVLNSVNRNASNEISQSNYMSKPDEITRFPRRIFCPVVYYLVLGAFQNVTLKLKEQLQITSELHYRILLYCQSSRLNTHSARKVNAFCKQASKRKCLPLL